jgi:cellulose synthase/poly-beta-1,6-N-acetylglucosamine synthase-like glycosyltransferase
MLQKLLSSISDCSVDRSLIGDVDINVLDNDPDKSAEGTICGFKLKADLFFKINYFHYSEKGLSNVRNELFRIASKQNPDYIVSIDDDEFVTKDWLTELVNTVKATGGEIAEGPVIASFTDPVPDHISWWFRREDYADKQQVEIFRSGNYIIDAGFLADNNLEFDSRFNSRGSEDSFFGYNAMKKGAKIFWAARAVAYESVPAERANLAWIMKRRFRGGNNFMFKLIIEKQYSRILRKSFISIIYLIAGILTLWFILIPSKFRFWGLLKISEGTGSLSSLINISSKGYYD